ARVGALLHRLPRADRELRVPDLVLRELPGGELFDDRGERTARSFVVGRAARCTRIEIGLDAVHLAAALELEGATCLLSNRSAHAREHVVAGAEELRRARVFHRGPRFSPAREHQGTIEVVLPALFARRGVDRARQLDEPRLVERLGLRALAL